MGYVISERTEQNSDEDADEHRQAEHRKDGTVGEEADEGRGDQDGDEGDEKSIERQVAPGRHMGWGAADDTVEESNQNADGTSGDHSEPDTNPCIHVSLTR
jgi:hypothetical protein